MPESYYANSDDEIVYKLVTYTKNLNNNNHIIQTTDETASLRS